ncbi:MAG: hypothetical protein KAY37_11665 [Phycisphaerae bacterium]|nr:hypothetical protein [Phycisphaerae bacterium]
MTSKLEALLARIHPNRTIDAITRDVDAALNSLSACPALITKWPEFVALMGRFHRHIEARILHLPDGVSAGDMEFSWSRCIGILNRAYGSSGPKAAFEMARTGNEGGIYAVLRKVADLTAEEYVSNTIGACVWNYWNSLSTDEKLSANSGRAFIGYYVMGMGFTFDDTDTSGVANPLSLMNKLVEKDRRNAERIFPYIGGEEVNDSPVHAHKRFIIDFADWPLRRVTGSCLAGANDKSWATASDSERTAWLRGGLVPLDYPSPVAADYPDLLAVVENRVKPSRDKQKRDANRERWWQYAEVRPGLTEALRHMERALVLARVSQFLQPVFLPTSTVFSEQLVVVVVNTFAWLGALQSRAHELWFHFFGSTQEERSQYTPSDCFESFPFPEKIETDPQLEAAGKTHYEFRAELMVRSNEGLTATYNRFHDPAEGDADILKLRELHDAMDRAVLDAYGWGDIETVCGFGLDYLDAEDEDVPEDVPEQLWWPTAAEALAFAAKLPQTRRRLPWRYRWPEETRDEVLALLLELNKQRAEEERRTGQAAAAAEKKKAKKTKRGRRKKQLDTGPTLIDLGEEDEDE